MYWRKMDSHYEEYNLYSNDGRKLAICDWVVGDKGWRVSCTPFHLIPYFKTLEEAKAYVFRKLLEEGEF